MLLFYPTEENQLPQLQRQGTPAGAVFSPSLEEARRRGDGRVLVVDANSDGPLSRGGERSPALPPSAFENLRPYHPPEPVAAGGGYVLRASEQVQPLPTRHLLLIHRRGVWDLPKGKQDPGEDVRACALREVREETGLGEVRILGPLGPTVHGYREKTPEGPRYCVKTTHWFLMETPEVDLTPERHEGIEKASWMPWREAGTRLGYETLRRHFVQAEKRASRWLQEGHAG